ncbi:uncharacterized protein F4812DRAFT_465273 [Daldinia caldariorum]|uniref:uncharacterized protein n=1 Tax=Daldinia caldariorum TaxID=326644 RepID=UPI002007747B|nr:uncharacterized protein F4812DRAFT_465273 [Daldinia caldariorum]KAI1467188.1 hypothetical protein F4812DRAFT_465273 [Daldinia caldariorum]
MVQELLSPTLLTIMFLGLTGLYGFVKFSHENDYATEVKLEKSSHHLSGGSARTLITYAYTESQIARENLAFFIDNALHPSADFIFILNGPNHAAGMMIPKEPNVRVVSRPQDDDQCSNLGSHGEVLRKDGLWKKYERFIVLGAGVRGPFVPYWSDVCWSDAFLSRVTEDVKLVGATASCHPKFHIEPLIWATDSAGMKLLLDPPEDSSAPHPGKTPVALGGCHKGKDHASSGEIEATSVIRKAGYEVDAMMAAFHQAGNYKEACLKGPVPAHATAAGKQCYGASRTHPYETLFVKADGDDVDAATVARVTEWYKPRGVKGSWDACRRGG